MTVTKTADILGVTKTSISRCFDELEALSIPYVHTKSRGRFLSVPADRKEMWETIRPVLRNPVIAAYSLKEKVTKNCRLSGISALAYYTMLESEQVPVYAVQKKDIASLDIIRSKISSAGETPGCIVHETGYQIDFEDGKAMDPLSVVLSLSSEEKEDPRISLAIDEMLEEFVWSKAWKDSGSISGNTPISMY
ncbi:MAG: hypothetical protein K6A40_02620 [Solobacterium sp.]|nr:hypothetical protein [Solobacterium sp.]